MASLTIDNITKAFGATRVLKGISLTAETGDLLVLVGPSGCGKSTLLNIIAGLDQPDGGILTIGGRVVTDVHPKDRDIAMVFQSYALYPNMTVRKNITFGMDIRGVPKAEQEEALTRVARILQIEPLLDRKPAQLSGGQRQRVAMGRALVRDPAVFLFDEPLSNLDAKLRVEMRTEIKKLHQRLGSTMVYVTHDQIEAMTLATKIAVMKDGIVQQFADPQTIYERPSNMFVAGFIGTPSMNFIPATVVEDLGRPMISVTGQDGQQIPLPLPEAGSETAPDMAAWVGREVILGLRPEHITHLRPADMGDGRHAAFDATVEFVEPTGADVMTFLRMSGTEVVARIDPMHATAPGQTMRLMVDMARACLFDPDTTQRLSGTEPPSPPRTEPVPDQDNDSGDVPVEAPLLRRAAGG